MAGSNGSGGGVKFCGLNFAWLQPLIILIVVTYVYVVYVGLNLLPALQSLNSRSSINDTSFFGANPGFQSFINDPHATQMSFSGFVVCTLGFHVLLIMFATAFVKTIVTPPGSVPVEKQADRKKWDDGLFDISPDDDQRIEDITLDHSQDLNDPEVQAFIRSMILVERKKEGNPQGNHGLKRHCKTCQIFKPDRTHHCKVCNHCVLRMDHHCPWVCNCIGFRNYKFFLLTIFYAILLTGWVLGSMLERFIQVFQPILNRHNFWYMDIPVAIAFGITLIVFVGLVVFFGFHVYMTMNALTSIERTEKKSSNNPDVQHRFKIAHIKFDYGWYQNWVHTMGPSHTWLFPVDANPEDDGTYSQMHLQDAFKER